MLWILFLRSSQKIHGSKCLLPSTSFEICCQTDATRMSENVEREENKKFKILFSREHSLNCTLSFPCFRRWISSCLYWYLSSLLTGSEFFWWATLTSLVVQSKACKFQKIPEPLDHGRVLDSKCTLLLRICAWICLVWFIELVVCFKQCSLLYGCSLIFSLE